jgi:ArsR family transcriptional regulator, zinc-responsive transcriptional repressor
MAMHMSMRMDRAARQIVETLDSEFFRALAEPVRIDVMRILLLQGASDINSIAKQLPQDRSVLSRHLQTLSRAGLVSCVKEGRHHFYALRGGAFIERLEHILSSVKALVATCCPEELK